MKYLGIDLSTYALSDLERPAYEFGGEYSKPVKFRDHAHATRSLNQRLASVGERLVSLAPSESSSVCYWYETRSV